MVFFRMVWIVGGINNPEIEQQIKKYEAGLYDWSTLSAIAGFLVGCMTLKGRHCFKLISELLDRL